MAVLRMHGNYCNCKEAMLAGQRILTHTLSFLSSFVIDSMFLCTPSVPMRMHPNYFGWNLVESEIVLENKTKKQVDDRNEWLRWREKISLWMWFKERKWGHCQKRKGCKMSRTKTKMKRGANWEGQRENMFRHWMEGWVLGGRMREVKKTILSRFCLWLMQ